MNKLKEQAKLVQDALREGKKVAVAVPLQDMFERVVKGMIPEDLEIAARPNRLHFRFTNGAMLSFIPTTRGADSVRGQRGLDLAFYYESMFETSPVDRERMEELYHYLREHGVEMLPVELP